ncbi:hypothetical protein RN001_009593 [Aquatica leii]|uniref:Uncharacterized protein n=1 Tax=Aquatica leii TaxID=1421715 RepID=A0AAN7PVJ0_9COLE|nr:hypothetical protein RN001_009593 [Aquatica leii]
MKTYNKKISKVDLNTNNASTPTGNYVLTPKTTVLPGVLSKFVPQRVPQRLNSSVVIKELSRPYVKMKKSTNPAVENSTPYKEVLLVNSFQGIFEIHFKYMELSSSGLNRINQFNKLQSLYLNLNFFSYEKTLIPLSYPLDNYVEIETSVVYVVSMNKSFINNISTKTVVLELFIQDENKNCYLASADLDLSEVLQYPSTDILAKLVFCDSDKALLLSDTGISINFGTLVLWFRLGCNEAILNRLITISSNYESSTVSMEKKNQKMKTSTQATKKSLDIHLCFNESKNKRSVGPTKCNEPDIFNECEGIFDSYVEPTNSETENFQEALDLVLTRNKALRTTQSEISFQLRDRARWLHEESNWKRTLQEHAILRGQDPENVQWRQWRTASTSKIKLQKYGSRSEIYSLNVVIKIEHLRLRKTSEPMQSDKFQSFYVEYAFLTHEGIEMESPYSVPKPLKSETMVINFEKRFCIDPKTNMKDCRKLAEAVRKNDELIISVVAEPKPNLNSVPCCQEVGICKISFLELVEKASNTFTDDLLLYNRKNKRHQIGCLRVSFEGLLAMRRIALKLLAPPSYILD